MSHADSSSNPEITPMSTSTTTTPPSSAAATSSSESSSQSGSDEIRTPNGHLDSGPRVRFPGQPDDEDAARTDRVDVDTTTSQHHVGVVAGLVQWLAAFYEPPHPREWYSQYFRAPSSPATSQDQHGNQTSDPTTTDTSSFSVSATSAEEQLQSQISDTTDAYSASTLSTEQQQQHSILNDTNINSSNTSDVGSTTGTSTTGQQDHFPGDPDSLILYLQVEGEDGTVSTYDTNLTTTSFKQHTSMLCADDTFATATAHDDAIMEPQSTSIIHFPTTSSNLVDENNTNHIDVPLPQNVNIPDRFLSSTTIPASVVRQQLGNALSHTENNSCNQARNIVVDNKPEMVESEIALENRQVLIEESRSELLQTGDAQQGGKSGWDVARESTRGIEADTVNNDMTPLENENVPRQTESATPDDSIVIDKDAALGDKKPTMGEERIITAKQIKADNKLRDQTAITNLIEMGPAACEKQKETGSDENGGANASESTGSESEFVTANERFFAIGSDPQTIYTRPGHGEGESEILKSRVNDLPPDRASANDVALKGTNKSPLIDDGCDISQFASCNKHTKDQTGMIDTIGQSSEASANDDDDDDDKTTALKTEEVPFLLGMENKVPKRVSEGNDDTAQLFPAEAGAVSVVAPGLQNDTDLEKTDEISSKAVIAMPLPLDPESSPTAAAATTAAVATATANATVAAAAATATLEDAKQARPFESLNCNATSRACMSEAQLFPDYLDSPKSTAERSSPLFTHKLEKKEDISVSGKVLARNMITFNNYSPSIFFQLLEELSCSTRGLVVRALDDDGRNVVLKVKRRGAFCTREKQRKLVEAINRYAQVTHPNVIQLLGVFSDERYIFQVLENVAGGDILSILRTRNNNMRMALSEQCVAQLIYDIASALRHYHENGIVHGAVQPEHILLTAPYGAAVNTAKLAGFTLGCQVDFVDNMTSGRGRMQYIAPEAQSSRCQSSEYGHPAADMWALGMCLYELLSGQLPDRKLSLYVRYGLPLYLPRSISHGVRHLIRSLLQRNPDKRITAVNVQHHKWLIDNTHLQRQHLMKQQRD